MPITALPENTVRAIGSTQTLTDSASLVKELVDNAIDGRATTISVELSANSLDDIRVKDNGHGIAPEDRSMICTRHCTSKIRDLKDLHAIGGQSLGFRGEALASAAEMSGRFTISTRIEGEETASELIFDRQGRITSEKHTSLPVGTTVRVEKFLDTLPVRRQIAEKNSIKLLAKVKGLLQAYVFARPYLRFSLKVLKAKNDRGNWKYPKIAGIGISKFKPSMFNAAEELIGKKVTDQCQWFSTAWSSTGEHIDSTSDNSEARVSQDGTYIFEAVLAKLECDILSISNTGQYLSVDSRPVSCAKGTLKQVVKLYKLYLKSFNTKTATTNLTDPFLCLNIACPPGTYDVNVEPAKDDVLFANPELILQIVGEHFKKFYGELSTTVTNTITPKSTSGTSDELMLNRKTSSNKNHFYGVPRPAKPAHRPTESVGEPTYQQSTPSPSLNIPLNTQDSVPPTELSPSAAGKQGLGVHIHPANGNANVFDAIGERLPMIPSSLEDSSPRSSSEASPRVLVGNPNWKGSMDADEEDDVTDLDNVLSHGTTPVIEEDVDEDTLRNVEMSNPWVLAKLSAAFRPPNQIRSAVERNGQLPTPGRQVGDVDTSTKPSLDDFSQCPDPSSNASSSPSLFPFPLKARGKRQGDDTRTKPQASGQESREKGALDNWVQRTLHNSGDTPSTAADSGVSDLCVNPNHPQHQRDFVSARSLHIGTSLSANLEVSQRPRRRFGSRKQHQGAFHEPNISPVNDPGRVWFDNMENRPKNQHVQSRPGEDYPYGLTPPTLNLRDSEDEDPALPKPSERTIHPDLAFAMDYEARKQEATDQHRQLLRQQAAAAKREARNRADASPNKTPSSSPHKNRQAKAIAALHTNRSPITEGDPITFEAGDPRAYLLRVQRSERSSSAKPSKSKRWKSTMLPFETLREEAYIGDLVLPLKTEGLNLRSQVLSSALYDEYIAKGKEVEAFSNPTTQEVEEWERRLKEMVKKLYRIEGMAPEEEMDGELDVDLASIIRSHVAATADLTVS